MADGDQLRAQDGSVYTVFLSYSREDRKIANQIYQILTKAGFTVWWDHLLAGGERFADSTEAALEGAKAVVVLWSKTSIGSHWVHDEATRGRDRRCLVPLSIDGSSPPLGFRQFQVIDVSHGRMRAGSTEMQNMIRVVAALHEQPAGTTPSPAPPARHGDAATPGPFNRRGVIIGGGLLALSGAAGLAAWKTGWFGERPDSSSIAILPFDNLSGDPAQAYFSDGLSEELRTTLSLNRQIAVAAQTSSNSFRGEKLDARAIAHRLNVAYILDGGVRRAGGVVRITAQLIDGSAGFEKWSQSFDRTIADIFAVQTEISLMVADALVKQLSGGDRSKLRIGGTTDTRAYDAFLRGKALYAMATTEASDREALALFESATALDPRYAAAHAARSRSLTSIANNYAKGDQLADYYTRAIAAARAALELAPDLAEAHAALGFALLNGKLDARAAHDPYRRSFELGFGNADILAAYANYAARTGDFAGARQAIARAERLDPLNPSVFRNAGVIEYGARRYGDAASALQTALSLNPRISGVHSLFGDIHLLQGDFDAARSSFSREPVMLARMKGLAIIEAKAKGRAAGETALAEMIARFGDNSLYQQAQVLAQWNEPDAAMAILERAYKAGDSGLVQSREDPLLDPLRADPRYKALQEKLGFA